MSNRGNYSRGPNGEYKIHTTYNQVALDSATGSWKGIRTGRLSSSEPNLHNIPKPGDDEDEETTGKALRRAFIASPGKILIVADYSQIQYRLLAHYSKESILLEAFRNGQDVHEATGRALGVGRKIGKTLNFACVASWTKVLTSNFDWKPVRDLRLGDSILTCTEEGNDNALGRGRARKWTTATITHHEEAFEEGLRITLSNGDSLVCTKEHPFLVNNHKKLKSKWCRAELLKVGWSIPKYLPSWEREQSFDAGWLSGMMDGEGYVSSTAVGISQIPGPIFDKICNVLSSLSVSFKTATSFVRYKGGNSPCNNAVLRGGLQSVCEILGRFRPSRLVQNFLKKIVNKVTTSCMESPRIVTIRPVGIVPIVRLSTSTGTYMTEGYFSHNSIFGAFPEKIAQVAHCTEDQAKEFLGRYWRVLPGVRVWMERVKMLAKIHRSVKTIFGRVIPINDIDSQDRGLRAHAERTAINYIIQGGEADIIKVAMKKLDLVGYTPILQVHDELHFETEATGEELDRQIAEIKGVMEGVIILDVPLTVSIAHGNSWYEAKE